MDEPRLIHKTLVEYNLYIYFHQLVLRIIKEITEILTEKNGYIYNSKAEKLKKHFPLSKGIDFDIYNDFLKKSLKMERFLTPYLQNQSRNNLIYLYQQQQDDLI